jgi:hypothetical protein
MHHRHTTGILLAIILLACLLGGCFESATPVDPEMGVGSMQVFLIDAPGDYDEVNVEIIGVRVHQGGADSLSGWHDIAVDTTLVNLLDYTDGNFAVLADSTLPAGHYTQVRLMLGEGNTVVVDGEIHDLMVPSGGQSGLKLNHPFDIEDGETYAVTLDFDADRSVHRTGNGQYRLRPVIHLIVNGMSGSIRGVAEPVDARALVAAIAGTDSVFAYADTLDGSFHFPMLTAGAYELLFTATAGSYRDSTLAGVSVIAGQETDLGTVVLE